MKILFVSTTRHVQNPYRDHSTRYRCFNPAEDLRLAGHIADVCPLSHFKPDYAYWYDAFIFHKPTYSGGMEKALAHLKHLGKPFVADYDDLIFDPANAAESSLHLSGRSSLKLESDKYKKNLKALLLFPNVTVSTDVLKKEVKASNPAADVTVVYNGLSERWLTNGLTLPVHEHHMKRISYFPGTRTHSRDLILIQNVLSAYLRENKNIELSIVGDVAFERNLFPPDRLKILAPVPYDELPGLIRASWITIAPLQDTSFNRCKSGLKFFESAAFGVPVVASPIPDMLRFSKSGILFARKASEWKRAFDFLNDGTKYSRISRRIREFSMQRCGSFQQTERLFNLLACLEPAEYSSKTRAGARYDAIPHRGALSYGTLDNVTDAIKRKVMKLCREPRRFCIDSKFASLRQLGTLGRKDYP